MSRIEGPVRKCLPDEYFFRRNYDESLLTRQEADMIVERTVQAVKEEVRKQLNEFFQNYNTTTNVD